MTQALTTGSGRTWRLATPDEIKDLAWSTCPAKRPTPEEIADECYALASYGVLVCENYMSDGPGYQGKVAVCLWGEPQYFDVFTEAAGGWSQERQERHGDMKPARYQGEGETG